MTIFVVLADSDSTILEQRLEQLFQGNYLKIAPGQWLVSSLGTVKEVSDSLGISDGTSGPGIVTALGVYFGRKPPSVWEWILSRLQRAS